MSTTIPPIQNPQSKIQNPCSRRRFLQTAAATAGILAAARAPFISRAWAAAGARSPFNNLVPANRKVRVACVGIGGKGEIDMNGAIDAGAEITALCDVDFDRGAKAFRQHPALPRYRDFRQMLDEMHDRIDALTISTPDHMHFPIAMMALERGKHIYVQKPLTHTIGEARLLKAAAIKTGLVTQMGNQGHANDTTRTVKEWLDAGVIGNVREVHSWTNRPSSNWPQGRNWPSFDAPPPPPRPPTKKQRDKGAAKSAPVRAIKSKPDTIDWDLWLGVAPYRDYLPYIAPTNWRGFWDYGCGALGDMGCHIMDAPYWSLNLSGDCTVTAEYDAPSAATIAISGPVSSTIKYEFPARGSLPPLTYYWHDGGRLPLAPKELGSEKFSPGGSLYYGDKGILYSPGDYCGAAKLLPDSRMKSFTPDKRPPKTIPRAPRAPGKRDGDPYVEWISAIQGSGIPPGSNIPGYSAGLVEFVSLGNLAIRAGKPIHWQSATATCAGLPEAQILINKNYRVY